MPLPIIAGLAAKFLATSLGKVVAQKAATATAQHGIKGFLAKAAVSQAKFAVKHPIINTALWVGPSLLKGDKAEQPNGMPPPPDPAELARRGASPEQIRQIMADYQAAMAGQNPAAMQQQGSSAYDPSKDPMLDPNYTGRSAAEIAAAANFADEQIAASGSDLGEQLGKISAGQANMLYGGGYKA